MISELVLGDLSVRHGQTRHFCRSAESYAGHLLWVGVVSFARKMAWLCSRGCRSLKTSQAKHFSKLSAKLVRQVQKSNATATDSIAEKPAIRSSCAWQEPSLHLVLCCVKPISTFCILTHCSKKVKCFQFCGAALFRVPVLKNAAFCIIMDVRNALF